MYNLQKITFCEEKLITIKKQFRFWHIEMLLNETADLIDQCLKDLVDLKQISAYEFNLKQELELRKQELEIEKNKNVYERQTILTGKEIESIDAINQQLNEVVDAANHVWQDVHGWTNVQNAREANTNLTEGHKRKEKAVILNNWAILDLDFNNILIDLKEKQLLDKISEQEGDKILSYSLQKKLCQERLFRNFNDYLERTYIIQEGLSKIYGIESEIFEDIQNTLIDSEKVNIAYNWTYNTIACLKKYSQLEQTFTLTLSLKELIGSKKFEELKSANKNYNVDFPLSKDLFPAENYENIRIRGISASIIGNVCNIPWLFKIKLPDEALYLRSGSHKIIKQNEVPLCIIGRVENRKSIRNIEICGNISLFNCSPISHKNSNWKLSIIKPNSNKELFSNIEEIIIELNLTGNQK